MSSLSGPCCTYLCCVCVCVRACVCVILIDLADFVYDVYLF